MRLYWDIDIIDNNPALVIRCVSGMIQEVIEQVLKETKNTVIYSTPVYFIFNNRRMEITRNSTPESVRQDYWSNINR